MYSIDNDALRFMVEAARRGVRVVIVIVVARKWSFSLRHPPVRELQTGPFPPCKDPTVANQRTKRAVKHRGGGAFATTF